MTRTMLTVDGHEAQDLDDGFFISVSPSGWVLQLYIALPALAVPFNHPLVKQAEEHVVTQYRGSNVLTPMLNDEALVSKCSLLPGGPLHALAVTLHLDSHGQALSCDAKLVDDVVSAGKLAYAEFGDIAKTPGHPLYEQVSAAIQCARALFYARVQQGDGMDLLDEETGKITDEEGNVRYVSLREIHAQIVVQEFMLLVNTQLTCWARQRQLPIIYRNHEMMTMAEIESSHPDIADAYRRLEVSRWDAMRQGLFSPAAFSMENRGHAGIGVDAYAPFSSPLRRYPDLHNQYVILSVLADQSCPTFTQDRCDALNATLSKIKQERHDNAKERAGFIEMARFRREGVLTPRQLTQVLKRHPGSQAKRDVLQYFVNTPSLHFSCPIWSSLITQPVPVGDGLRESLMGLYDRLNVGQNVYNHILQTGGVMSVGENCFQAKVVRDKLFKNLGGEDGEAPAMSDEDASQSLVIPNAKGRVLAYYQGKGLPMPEPEVINKGKPHLPLWEVRLRPGLDGLPATMIESAVKKRQAEGVIYHKIADALNLADAKNGDAPLAPACAADSKPARSVLNEHCQKNNLSPLQLNVSTEGSGFACLATLVGNAGECHEQRGTGRTKKAAVNAACDALVAELFGTPVAVTEPVKQSPRPVPDVSNNAKSTLHEMASQGIIDNLVFNTAPAPEGFTCAARCDYAGKAVAKESTSTSKKAAEKAAAAHLHESLRTLATP